jgi:hypothetical protein
MASKRTNEDAAPAPTQVSIVAKDRRAALTVLVREFKLADGKVIGLKSGVGRVRLSHRAGQIAVWGKDGDETVTITADGYSECNRVACVSVMTPADMVDVLRDPSLHALLASARFPSDPRYPT